METKQASFTDNHGFEVTLTDEKLYIKATGLQESFALRSISGCGTYDDIEKLNKEITEFKKKKNSGVILAVIGGCLILLSLIMFTNEETRDGAGTLIVIAGLLFIPFFIQNKKTEPELDSYFRIMLPGGDRKFIFRKTSVKSNDIADLINKLEKTLTAYK